MKYCVVNSENIIENIIEAEADFAGAVGALPHYEGADIGAEYAPPESEPELTTEQRVAALEEAMKRLLSGATGGS